ncbi:MAG: glycosyltransferase [Chloroflexota bacterium]
MQDAPPHDPAAPAEAPGDATATDPVAPLRPRPIPRPPLLARVLTHYRRHGVRATFARVGAEARLRREARRRPRALRPPEDRDADWIRLAWDLPAADAIGVPGSLRIEGWAVAPRGLAALEVLVDGELVVRTGTGLARPDLALALPDVPGVECAGFAVLLPVDAGPPGTRIVSVAAHDRAGATRAISRVVTLVDPEAAWHRYRVARLAAPGSAAEVPAGATGPACVVDARPPAGLGATLAALAAQTLAPAAVVVTCDPADAAAIRAHLAAEPLPGRVAIVAPGAAPGDPDLPGIPGDGLRVWLRAGETLLPDALARLAAPFSDPDLLLAWSAHDTLEATGRHRDPVLGPGRAPIHLLGEDHVGGVFCVRDDARLARARAATGDPARPAWRYALLLALDEEEGGRVRLEEPLWSAPMRPPDAAAEADARAAVAAALARRGVDAEVLPGPGPGLRRVRHRPPAGTRVSLIVPTTGKLALLAPLLDSLAAHPAGVESELIVIDNGRGRDDGGIALARARGARILERDEPFNWSRLNNAAAAVATGDVLCFLNDDIEVRTAGWLAPLAGLACAPGVGAVGTLLLYPDGRVQHGGVTVVAEGASVEHRFTGLDPDAPAAPTELGIARETFAVTGAALVVRAATFRDVGGFDERLAVNYNDTDLCLRLAARGLRNVWSPEPALVHHESATRGRRPTPADDARFLAVHGRTVAGGDPWRHPWRTQAFRSDPLDWAAAGPAPVPSGVAGSSGGVNLAGYIRDEMGIGEATRGMAHALSAAGIPFCVLEARKGPRARRADHGWAHRIVDRPLFPTTILHVNPDTLPLVLGELPAEATAGRRTIGVWAWETEELPSRWHDLYRCVDEIWAPSTFVRDALLRSATVPVHVVPHAVRSPDGPFLSRAELGLPEGRVLFLAMYDPSSMIERKNPDGALRAFLAAFPAADRDVGLVLKVNAPTDGDLRRLRALLPDDPRIVVIDRPLDRHAVDSLIHACDALISLHRAEGFGLVVAEARALGRPVVTTDWSGTTDFADASVAMPVGYRLVRLGRTIGPYPASARWAEPDPDAAVAALRALRDDPALRARLGAAAGARIAERLAPAVVGARIADLLAAGAGRPGERT